MRILAIGDLHGKFPKKLNKDFIRKNKIDIIISPGDLGSDKTSKYVFKYWKQQRERERQDANVPRDIVGHKKWDNLILQEVKSSIKIIKRLSSLGVPLYFVYGNGDTSEKAWYFDKNYPSMEQCDVDGIKGATFLEMSSRKIDGYEIFGFGCRFTVNIRTKKHYKKIRNREKKRLDSFFRKRDASKVILLTHETPYMIFDKILYKGSPRYGQHVGDDILKEAIKKYQPALHICGHMHEYQGRKNINKTAVIIPGYGKEGKVAIIDLPKRKVKFFKI